MVLGVEPLQGAIGELMDDEPQGEVSDQADGTDSDGSEEPEDDGSSSASTQQLSDDSLDLRRRKFLIHHPTSIQRKERSFAKMRKKQRSIMNSDVMNSMMAALAPHWV